MEKTFEENIKELEEIVAKLEKGELDLDRSIKNFEQGIKISKECSKTLEDAERRINLLVESDSFNYSEEKFTADE